MARSATARCCATTSRASVTAIRRLARRGGVCASGASSRRPAVSSRCSSRERHPFSHLQSTRAARPSRRWTSCTRSAGTPLSARRLAVPRPAAFGVSQHTQPTRTLRAARSGGERREIVAARRHARQKEARRVPHGVVASKAKRGPPSAGRRADLRRANLSPRGRRGTRRRGTHAARGSSSSGSRVTGPFELSIFSAFFSCETRVRRRSTPSAPRQNLESSRARKQQQP